MATLTPAISPTAAYVWPVRGPVTITTTTTAPPGINDGLVAYYPFNGNANDESGHGHNGTVHGAINSAGTYLFDGLDDYIEIPYSPELDLSNGDFTLCAWINPLSIPLTGTEMLIVSKWVPNPKSYLLSYHNNNPVWVPNISFRVNDDWNYVYTNQINLTNSWHYVVAIKKQNDLYVYVDGSLIGQDYIRRSDISAGQGSILISWPTSSGSGYCFNGYIDEVRFYNRSISEAEIAVLYNNNPTVISLSSFVVTPRSSSIVIQWSTESEIDNAGFNIYRSDNENGEYLKINASLIPTKGSATQGASYEYVDTGVQNRKTYYYKLEDIDTSGISTFHGPVKAAPRWIYGVGK